MRNDLRAVVQCKWCGSSFSVPRCRVGKVKSCQLCAPNPGAMGRFWRKVKVGKTENDCWEWLGSRHPHGHGYGYIRGKVTYAHRVSWELLRGPIPNGMDVCHSCDNPPCVNPWHLFLGTHADNMRDAKVKGRMPKGERHRFAKLTDEKVRDIRRRYAAGERITPLSREYGVYHHAIAKIVHGKAWTHVV